MIYTGIGSRATPKDVLNLMTEVGRFFARKGWLLRSGGANGADSAFEAGCDLEGGDKDIFLPWKGFNGKQGIAYNSFIHKYAEDIAEKIWDDRTHLGAVVPWDRLRSTTKSFMVRNMFQVMGINLNHPSNIVVCWTPDGQASGGTGQAIAYANKIDVPVINLQSEENRAKFWQVINGNYDLSDYFNEV